MSEHRVLEPPAALNMRLTLSVHKTVHRVDDGFVWTTRTPEGPASVQIRPGVTKIELNGWGDGAQWALKQCPSLLGFDDKPELFVPVHDSLTDLARQNPGLRIGASGRAWEVLFWAILGQKVQ
ncbi:MAG: 3-methyladenine DNA glycosylase, partial [Acidimicrobiales bacterium]